MGGEPFSYSAHRNGTIRISWQGRVVLTLGGSRAARLIADLEGAGEEEAQYLLQRVTGNFKRGNERRVRR